MMQRAYVYIAKRKRSAGECNPDRYEVIDDDNTINIDDDDNTIDIIDIAADDDDDTDDDDKEMRALFIQNWIAMMNDEDSGFHSIDDDDVDDDVFLQLK
ncbi:hypothetical protein PV326_007981 [Microctonus aethiopoides]|nr:hypothetical protein PV326_007981 [Microctonus aethiopoides]